VTRVTALGEQENLSYTHSAIVQVAPQRMKLDLQALTLKALILVAGTLAAVLLAMKGQTQALPGLAIGSTLGVILAGRFGTSEE